ncbi:MAG: site-2 protease family protein [Hormoscilla sp. GM7CHS1pb]|nr:site-2 protease family protein [Hormoscilla sp. GM7CHS1pb]
MIFWLIFLGLITYFIVGRSVAGITRTPVWLLWLVLMTPALIWTGWTSIYGENTPPPRVLIWGPFLICPLLYWLLVRLGSQGMPRRQAGQQQAQSRTSVQQQPTLQFDRTSETKLKDCFPWSVYYLTEIEYRPQVVVCRGRLRATPEVAYQRIRSNIEAEFGDRFLVLFQEGWNNQSQPFFTLFPNPHVNSTAKKPTLTRPGLALGLLAVTGVTTTFIGTISIAGVSREAVFADPKLLLLGMPYALALMLILGIHELGHYLTARHYDIRTTLPYFIPVPFFLGTFGAFIQIRSAIPNRKAVFDVGIAGPVAGLVATLPLLLWGLAHSQVVPENPDANLLSFTALDPKRSTLLVLLSKLVLGSALTPDSAIQLHPVAVAGYLGLVVTALNLMPVGQLDGGHVVHAIFGQRTAVLIGHVTRFLVLILAMIKREFFLWAIVLLFMPVYDEPALNDVSRLDNWRDLAGLLAISLLLMIILPAPMAITQLLLGG